MRRLNPRWCEVQEEKIAAWRRDGTHIETVASENFAIEHIIVRLAKESIPFRLINLGAGVKRITTDTQVCPKCGGTGRC